MNVLHHDFMSPFSPVKLKEDTRYNLLPLEITHYLVVVSCYKLLK